MISKNIDLPSGVQATFHRIDAMASRFDGTGPKPITVAIEVGSYLDQASATSGKQPVSKQTISVKTSDEPSLATMYAWLTAPLTEVSVPTPTVTMVNGVATPGVTNVMQTTGDVTGFNSATLI